MASQKTIRVLCVEDEIHDRELIRHALESDDEKFVMLEAVDRESFEAHLAHGNFDVVLTDFNILGFDGIEVIRAVTAHWPDIPVVVVTGTGSEEVAVQSLKEGAADYVIKTTKHIVQLPYTIRRALQAKETDLRLKEKNANFQAVIENTSDGILVVDTRGTILFANPAAERMFGASSGQLIQTRFDHFLAGFPYSMEIPLPNRMGRPGTGTMRVSETVWNKEKSYIVTIRDMTEQSQMRRALVESEDRFRAVADSAQDAIIVIDFNGLVTYWNPAATRIFGYLSQEMIGKKIDNVLVMSNDSDKISNALATFTKTGESLLTGQVIEFTGVTKEGKQIPIELSVSRFEHGGFWHVVVIVRDIRQRKSLEAQLMQSQRLEAVGRLAGGVAHDFNNMLSIILGYGENLLMELDPTDPLRGDVKEIIAAGKRSAELTRQLLAFSRKQTLHLEVIDLNYLVRNLEKMLRRLIGEDIELTLVLTSGLCLIKVDPSQMEQVIMNLAVNARDAMPTGGKLLIETECVELSPADVQWRQGMKPGRHAMLAMTDTGSGMDSETISRIFEPFFTTKEKGKGTGLGLATVYGIVKQLGGTIWVYSEPDQGTTFKIYIPETDEIPNRQEETTKLTHARGQGQGILVVEDEPGFRKLMKQILTKNNYEVFVAENGYQAMELVQKQGIRPELIITDVVMPGMSGKEMVNRIKTIYSTFHVLYMSGYTDNAIVHYGILEPDILFIQKPFTPERILERVEAILKGDT